MCSLLISLLCLACLKCGILIAMWVAFQHPVTLGYMLGGKFGFHVVHQLAAYSFCSRKIAKTVYFFKASLVSIQQAQLSEFYSGAIPLTAETSWSTGACVLPYTSLLK